MSDTKLSDAEIDVHWRTATEQGGETVDFVRRFARAIESASRATDAPAQGEQTPIGFVSQQDMELMRMRLPGFPGMFIRLFGRCESGFFPVYSAPVNAGPAPNIPTWQERMDKSGRRECESLAIELMQAEIADLRTALKFTTNQGE